MKTLIVLLSILISAETSAREIVYSSGGISYVNKLDDNSVFYALNNIAKGEVHGFFRDNKTTNVAKPEDVQDRFSSPFENYNMSSNELVTKSIIQFLNDFDVQLKPVVNIPFEPQPEVEISEEEFDVCAENFINLAENYLKLVLLEPKNPQIKNLKRILMKDKNDSVSQVGCFYLMGKDLRMNKDSLEESLTDELVILKSLKGSGKRNNVLTKTLGRLNILPEGTEKQILSYFYERSLEEIYFQNTDLEKLPVSKIVEEIMTLDLEVPAETFKIGEKVMSFRKIYYRDDIRAILKEVL
jgi:hypothetical protein